MIHIRKSRTSTREPVSLTGKRTTAIVAAAVDNPDSLERKEPVMPAHKTSPDLSTGLRPIREPLARVMEALARKIVSPPKP